MPVVDGHQRGQLHQQVQVLKYADALPSWKSWMRLIGFQYCPRTLPRCCLIVGRRLSLLSVSGLVGGQVRIFGMSLKRSVSSSVEV